MFKKIDIHMDPFSLHNVLVIVNLCHPSCPSTMMLLPFQVGNIILSIAEADDTNVLFVNNNLSSKNHDNYTLSKMILHLGVGQILSHNHRFPNSRWW
jgi:hypothetical protein